MRVLELKNLGEKLDDKYVAVVRKAFLRGSRQLIFWSTVVGVIGVAVVADAWRADDPYRIGFAAFILCLCLAMIAFVRHLLVAAATDDRKDGTWWAVEDAGGCGLLLSIRKCDCTEYISTHAAWPRNSQGPSQRGYGGQLRAAFAEHMMERRKIVTASAMFWLVGKYERDGLHPRWTALVFTRMSSVPRSLRKVERIRVDVPLMKQVFEGTPDAFFARYSKVPRGADPQAIREWAARTNRYVAFYRT